MKRQEFIDYVFEFYGEHGIYADFFGAEGVSRKEIGKALTIRLKNKDLPFDGDSLDREVVRDIMLFIRGERQCQYDMKPYFRKELGIRS